jgi:geranylgeranyl diphosphate synthase type I
MSLQQFMDVMLPAIEAELQHQIARLNESHTRPFYEMLTYHMGWTGEGLGKDASGKRIRPLLLLLTTASCEADWLRAAPAAAAVELVHNFSLVHDDIQDNSSLRRGRPTVWNKWGSPMAINVGDALFVISNQALMDLATSYPAETILQAAVILNHTCLELTRGQFLDMSYEERTDLTLEEYWPMVGGKTSALLSACTRTGALLGGVIGDQQEAYSQFGFHLGLAFQIQDDILGIWGNPSLTGKSTVSDLVEGKNSLPVLYALGRQGKFKERWSGGSIKEEEVNALTALLTADGARDFAQKTAADETRKALSQLERAKPRGAAGQALLELADRLLSREQ